MINKRMFMFINMFITVVAGTQIAYDIDTMECASSNHLNDGEACRWWRLGMKYRNMQHIFCKPIILHETNANGFQCTPTIVDYDGTMIYLQFTQVNLNDNVKPNIKVLIDYKGASIAVQQFWSIVGICIGISICVCACMHNDDQSYTSYRHHRSDRRRYSDGSYSGGSFASGMLLGNLMSRGRRRTNATGGWGVAS